MNYKQTIFEYSNINYEIITEGEKLEAFKKKMTVFITKMKKKLSHKVFGLGLAIFLLLPYNTAAQFFTPIPNSSQMSQIEQQFHQDFNALVEYANTTLTRLDRECFENHSNPDISYMEHGERVGWASAERLNQIRQKSSQLSWVGSQFRYVFDEWLDDIESMPVDVADFFDDLFDRIIAFDRKYNNPTPTVTE